MVLKIYGVDASSNCIPVIGLLEENGIKYEFVSVDLQKGDQKKPEFLAKNPMHCIPTFDEDGFTLWESKAILRYIANSNGLDSWYPSDPKERAAVDLALDFNMNTFYELVTKTWLYPKLGYASAPSEQAVKDAVVKWDEDVSKAFTQILNMSVGPFFGGRRPSIADLSFFGLVGQLLKHCPDCPVSKSTVIKEYFDALKGKLPKYAKYLKGV